MTTLTQSTTWKALQAHTSQLPHMRELFAQNPQRFEQMSVKACGLFLDYSKNRINNDTLELLFALAKEANLADKIAAMFKGDVINNTEQRSVLHTALRSKPNQQIIAEGANIVPEVQQTLAKMAGFVVIPSAPQLKERLSLEPSRLSSPFCWLCF